MSVWRRYPPLICLGVIAAAAGLSAPGLALASEGEGFAISIGGKPIAGDKALADKKAVADRALAKADIQVRFDGLHARPRLATVIQDTGGTLRAHSMLNYPGYVTRGEFRLVREGPGRDPETVAVIPVAPNGSVALPVPERGLVLYHRVYDANGRYDETRGLPLDAAPDTGPVVEEGLDQTARRRIPVRGGAITVSGRNVRQGAQVQTLGESIMADPAGNFAIERILPVGQVPVAVRVTGAGEDTYIERDITIPRSEWFHTGIVDLTYGYRTDPATIAGIATLPRRFSYGRIAGYAKGNTANGWTITASADTGEQELKDLFRDFDKQDPANVLLRLQREGAYPTYGDDSSIEDGAPTDGKFYIRAEKNGSHVMWGRYRSTVGGGYFLRNERTLYGFQGLYRSQGQTSRGQALAYAEAYAASPDRLPARDTFAGTGGSAYFLQRQDISVGSETVSVEIRDRDTGRVIDSVPLAHGRDYEINTLQGIVTLTRPLTGSLPGGMVITDPSGEYDVRLVVQYEYTPGAANIDGLSYGGRAEIWAADRLRLGVTGIVEQTGIADQTAGSVDLRYELSKRSYVHLEYAQSRGPGFGSSFSPDGGLTITNTPSAGTAGGTGKAYLARFHFDLAEIGSAAPGELAGYYERRTAGFSTLDYETAVNEELWGLSLRQEPSDRLRWSLSYDDYRNGAGKIVREGGIEMAYRLDPRVELALGAEYIEKRTPGGLPEDNGSRTDIAARLTFTRSDDLQWHVFGQSTLSRAGGMPDNARIGAGIDLRFAKGWSLEGELSGGPRGTAAKLLLAQERGDGSSSYAGYRLEPGRTISGVALTGRDQGQFVAGGRRRVGENTDVFGENVYDLFGRHTALTGRYGVEYRASEYLTLGTSIETGDVRDGAGRFERRAVSFSLRYSDGERFTSRAKLEYRRDRGAIAGTSRDQDIVLFQTSGTFRYDDERRLIYSFEYADNDVPSNPAMSGQYIDGTLGYAFRPVLHDRFNLLFKYRYLYDMVGQEIDGTALRGPRQESHVLSLDADYDLNRHWTLGGKAGFRLGRSAPDDMTALARNDAWLGVLNARYHVNRKWDLLLEGRYFEAQQAGLSEFGLLAAGYRHVGDNLKLGLGYNFGQFSDDLTDLVYDDKGVFINLIAKF